MAQMSLQRAAHVFNRIKTETAFGTEVEDAYGYPGRRSRQRQHNTFALTISVSVDDQVKQQADAYRRLALGKKNQMFTLMEIGTKIRGAMAEQQANCGVTRLVTDRVMTANKIKILEHFLESVETSVFVAEQFERQAQAIKSRLESSTQGATSANVSTPVLTSDDRDNLRRELAELRSTQMRIDDELGTLNATNHITISDPDLEVLREAGLSA